jgi:hypothetical protein
MTVVWTLPGKSRTGLGDAAAQQSANFVVEMVWGSIATATLSYSLAVRMIILIRKRRETGDGPI